ncbi:unnamed protein product [Peronospora farinosa]|uniref:Uncharacterized protein n=1 Tax=Peronospora farinosa TaxID=134698 RepID=A0AAV0SRQ6_9STRA|nr:unnamed protein product [Peronospora farinosa]CAI5706669.1 unnamed protein product [Peronospora farinosa]
MFGFRGNCEIRKAQWEISEDPKQRPQFLCRENSFVQPIASLLLLEQQNHQKEQSSTEVPTCKSHVRNLSHRIAQAFIESTLLRTQSKHNDYSRRSRSRRYTRL